MSIEKIYNLLVKSNFGKFLMILIIILTFIIAFELVKTNPYVLYDIIVLFFSKRS